MGLILIAAMWQDSWAAVLNCGNADCNWRGLHQRFVYLFDRVQNIEFHWKLRDYLWLNICLIIINTVIRSYFTYIFAWRSELYCVEETFERLDVLSIVETISLTGRIRKYDYNDFVL